MSKCYTSFLQEDIILVGGEIGEIMIYDIKKKTSIQMFKAHENRYGLLFQFLFS